MVEQATILDGDLVLKRWFVYESDGHRLVTWAPDEAAALAKLQRAGRFGPDSTVANTRIEPAPSMAEVRR